MADWNLPVLISTYVDVLNILKERDVDAATLFLDTPTNPISGFIRYNRVDNRFEEWDGSSWVPRQVSISGGGTGASDAAGARTNLGLGSLALQNSNSVDITGGTITGLSVLNVSGTVSAGLFSGSGANLTNIPNAATTATNLNSPNTIVLRDASGNFFAGTITASLNGNASTVTNGIYSNQTYNDPPWLNSLSGSKILTGIDASNITAGTLSDSRLSNNVIRKGSSWSQVAVTDQAVLTHNYGDNEVTVTFDLPNANTDYEIFNAMFRQTMGSATHEGTGYDLSGNLAPISLPVPAYGPMRNKINVVGTYFVAAHITFEVINAGFIRIRLESGGEFGPGNTIARAEGYANPGYIVLNCAGIVYIPSVPTYITGYAVATSPGNRIISFQGQRSNRLSIAKIW